MRNILPYPLHTLAYHLIIVHIGSMSYEEDNGGKRCLECGDVLPYGRKDMKFCSSSCKNKWHYQSRSWVGALKLRTRSILDKNYSIPEALLESGVTSIDILNLRRWATISIASHPTTRSGTGMTTDATTSSTVCQRAGSLSLSVALRRLQLPRILEQDHE